MLDFEQVQQYFQAVTLIEETLEQTKLAVQEIRKELEKALEQEAEKRR